MSAAPLSAVQVQSVSSTEARGETKKTWSWVNLKFLNKCFTYCRRFSYRIWDTLPSYLPFYLLVIVVGHASWKAQTPVTIITPFQQPKGVLPFSGEIVADALQDALSSIQNGIDREKHEANFPLSDMDLPELRYGLDDMRNILNPKFMHVQGTPQFKVEVNGLSYDGIISVARTIIGTETTISGDMIVNGRNFVLVARAADGGPWQSISSPLTAEGLKRATRDLAKKILAAKNPTFAGVALLEDGQLGEGFAAFQQASRSDPTNLGTKMNLCMAFAAHRRYDEAIRCYEEARAMSPDRYEISERLARVYYLKGDRESAIDVYDKLAHKQGYKTALRELAEAYEGNGQHAEALKAYNDFLAADRRPASFGIANRGAALSRAGKHDEALDEYRKALVYAPGDVLILTNIGVELAETGDLDAGIAQLQSVVDENINTDSVPFAFLKLGILMQKKGDWRHAADQFRRAIELRPNYVEAHLKLADALTHEGRSVEALSEYSKVAKFSGRAVDRTYSQVFAREWFGNGLRDQGKYAAAASVYREVILNEPDYGMARCELGFVLQKLGHRNQAIQQYQAALAVTSKVFDSKEWVVLAHQRLGEVLLSKGRTQRTEGIAELRKAIELDRKRLEPYLSLGKALYDEGNFGEAASQYQEAIKIDPQCAAAHNGLARALAKQGLVEQAASEYNNAEKVNAASGAYSAKLRSPRTPTAPN